VCTFVCIVAGTEGCRSPLSGESNVETKNQKNEMLRRNGTVIKSVESVLNLEGSLWWERFVKEVGLEPGVKERESYEW